MLLRRGYTLSTISELIGAWSTGQGIAELLGLDGAIAVPWSDETPELRDGESLAAGFGPFAAEDLRRAARLGFIDVHGGDVLVPSPKLLQAGAQLVLARVPLSAVLDLAEALKTQLEAVAGLLFRMFREHVALDGRPAAEVAEKLMRLRPFTKQTLDALLSMALELQSQQLLEQRAARSRRSIPGARRRPAAARISGSKAPGKVDSGTIKNPRRSTFSN